MRNDNDGTIGRKKATGRGKTGQNSKKTQKFEIFSLFFKIPRRVEEGGGLRGIFRQGLMLKKLGKRGGVAGEASTR